MRFRTTGEVESNRFNERVYSDMAGGQRQGTLRDRGSRAPSGHLTADGAVHASGPERQRAGVAHSLEMRASGRLALVEGCQPHTSAKRPGARMSDLSRRRLSAMGPSTRGPTNGRASPAAE